MPDLEKIQADVIDDEIGKQIEWERASKVSALEQCIYLFVEGESEEIAFRIILEEGLGIDFSEYGIVIANYNGIGNLKHVIRIMDNTLSLDRPMIFTFDDDDPSKVPAPNSLTNNIHLFKVPCTPTVQLTSGQQGGSFEESFLPQDFIDACFDTDYLRANTHIKKQDFEGVFSPTKPFYPQMVNFLKSRKSAIYALPKPAIAENIAVACNPIPPTYVGLGDLIKTIRQQYPVEVKI
ncbi:TOPRIM nucleotidyl transferase/hydrolase domain-containing protein [Vibrio sp. 10N.222.54.B12]|uniref:TOPRIM nucleotidyl transferase/hydrolase domain-containing protein n=1 Tax=Vibrio sp. 10N.222.54.B12 TaxID=3229636 RepID=UPI00354D85CA